MGETAKRAIGPCFETFFSIVNCEVLVWDALEKAFHDAGLPLAVGRFIPLLFLSEQPLRLSELASLAHAKESAMSRMVERMVKDGLVEKRRDSDDGRAVMLHITQAGREVELQGRALAERHFASAFNRLDDAELLLLRTMLSKVAQGDIASGLYIDDGSAFGNGEGFDGVGGSQRGAREGGAGGCFDAAQEGKASGGRGAAQENGTSGGQDVVQIAQKNGKTVA